MNLNICQMFYGYINCIMAAEDKDVHAPSDGIHCSRPEGSNLPTSVCGAGNKDNGANYDYYCVSVCVCVRMRKASL